MHSSGPKCGVTIGFRQISANSLAIAELPTVCSPHPVILSGQKYVQEDDFPAAGCGQAGAVALTPSFTYPAEVSWLPVMECFPLGAYDWSKVASHFLPFENVDKVDIAYGRSLEHPGSGNERASSLARAS